MKTIHLYLVYEIRKSLYLAEVKRRNILAKHPYELMTEEVRKELHKVNHTIYSLLTQLEVLKKGRV